VFRNVYKLFNHLASPSEGLGKSSGCAHVKSAAPAVQIKYAAEVVSRAWAWSCRVPKKKYCPRGLCYWPTTPPTTTERQWPALFSL
jgi:hypothetical protein